MLRRANQHFLTLVRFGLFGLCSFALTANAYEGFHGKVGKVKKRRVFVIWPNTDINEGDRVFVLNKKENGIDAELLVTQVKKSKKDSTARFSTKIVKLPKSANLKDFKNRIVVSFKELQENISELSKSDDAIILIEGTGSNQATSSAASTGVNAGFSTSNPLVLLTGKFASRQAKELSLLSGSSQSVSVKNTWLGATTFLTESTGLNSFGIYFEYLFKSPVTIDYKAADSDANRKAEYKEGGSRAGIIYRATVSGKTAFRYGLRINAMDSLQHSFKYDSASSGGVVYNSSSAEVSGFGVAIEAAATFQDKLLVGFSFSPPISKAVKMESAGQSGLSGTMSELDFQFHVGSILTPKIGESGVYAEITGAFQYNSRTYAGLDDLSGAEFASGSNSNFLVAVAVGYSAPAQK